MAKIQMEKQMKQKGYRILVIGESVSSQALGKKLVEHPDIEAIITSADLSESCRISVEQKIDIIIVDFFLKDGTALDCLQHQSLTNKQNKAVIVLIESASYPMIFCAYRKGAHQVVVKDKSQQYIGLIQKIISRLYKYQDNDSNAPGARVNINHAMIGLDLQYKVKFLNAAAVGYMGKSFSALIGKDMLQVMPGLDKIEQDLIIESLGLAKSTKQPQPIGAIRMASIEHDLAKVDLIVHPIFSKGDTVSHFIVSMQESVMAQGNRATHEWMQNMDSLTGTLNHEAFLNRLNHILLYSERYEQGCAVLHLDVDGFKAVNDALGYALANQLLKMIANRIKGIIREVDVISRVGADEFILVLTHTDKPEDSARLADKIMRVFKAPFMLEGVDHFLTLSIGIALFPSDAKNMESILHCASGALSVAKSKGKNNYQFYKADVTRSATNVVSLANDLHVALERNQFELYFQPQVSVTDFHVIGLEALIRWHHPEKGMISPALFIPIAEQMGMICDIGQWVIEESCRSIVLFEKSGYKDFILGVNLSVNQFMREQFLSEIDECIERYNVSPSRIEFEITESIFAHDSSYIIQKLNMLKAKGFQLVMDDFGTGYSCLSYLTDLPLEGIKIDRAFVQAMDGADKNKFIGIVSAIITLAQQLEIKTLAEGIESLEQAQYLAALGCDHLQGFYFSKPLSMVDCLHYLQKSSMQAKPDAKAS